MLQVTTSNQGTVDFSPDNTAQQLRRWQDIAGHARELGKNIVTLDLSVPDNIPAVMTDIVAAVTVPAPKIINPQPTKKRNV